jgi:hypothetical protein
VSRAVVSLEVFLKYVACSRVSVSIVLSMSRVVVSLEVLFEVCRVLSCLSKHCFKYVTCYRVSVSIVLSMSRAVVSL